MTWEIQTWLQTHAWSGLHHTGSHLFPPDSPCVCLTRACMVSYRHNGGFVLRLRSDSCHRPIPPDLLMGLTTNQSVLEIKNPFVPFCLNSLSDLLSERKPSHRSDDSSVIPQKPWNISHVCYATYPPCPPFCMNAWNTQWLAVLGTGKYANHD